MKDFAAMNEAYIEFLPKPMPSRSCLQAVPPGDGTIIEIECIAQAWDLTACRSRAYSRNLDLIEMCQYLQLWAKAQKLHKLCKPTANKICVRMMARSQEALFNPVYNCLIYVWVEVIKLNNG